MLPASLFLELLIGLLTGVVFVTLWRAGKKDALAEDRGWNPVLIGFGLLFFGALVDISDHFPALNRFVILGQTPAQSVAEKLVGFLGGYLLLTIGLFRWLPYVAERRRQADRLRSENENLAERLRRGSREMELNRLRSEAKVQQHLKQARQTENLVEAVASDAPMALFATGPGGRVSVAAGRALTTLNIEEEPIGASLSDLLPAIAESLSQALEGERVTTMFQTGDLTFQARCLPWLEDDQQIGAVVVATDITDLVRVQQELTKAKEIAEAASRAKSDFLANMSHELRTPLNSVIGFANLLEKNKSDRLSEKELKFSRRISDNGKHLLTLINDILDVSKIEAGRMETQSTSVDVHKLIHEIAVQMAPQAPKGVQLVVEMDGSSEDPTTNPGAAVPVPKADESSPTYGMIESDPAKLRQILVNLTANALKFTHQGTVSLYLESGSDGLPRAVLVKDTGIGIPEDQLASIFEAFQQVDSGIARRYTGTGLGLSITRSLCELLGYRLSVESEIGKGSVFRVDFS